LKQIISILCVLLFTSCTWVKDGDVECDYGFWLNLHYTYNILDVDAAPEYIKDVSVYVYDADSNYVTRIDIAQPLLLANKHRVRIEGLPEGDYQFVVWSGQSNSEYAVSDGKGKSDQFRLSLSDQSNTVMTKLPDLYHGKLDKIHYDDKYAVHDVYMMKNTNQLACFVVPLSQDVKMNPSDYVLEIVADNGTMDINNEMASDKLIHYSCVPEQAVINDDNNVQLHGIKYNLSTLRLMENGNCRLVLTKKSDNQTDQIFNISFPKYIGEFGSLYTKLGKKLEPQEYLDRQDYYTVIFFLSEELDQLMRLQVNGWLVRFNNLKLN